MKKILSLLAITIISTISTNFIHTTITTAKIWESTKKVNFSKDSMNFFDLVKSENLNLGLIEANNNMSILTAL